MIIVANWESKFNATIKFLIIVTIFLVINYKYNTGINYSLVLIMNGAYLFFNALSVKYTLLFDNNKYFLKNEYDNLIELPFDKKIGEEKIIKLLKMSHNYRILLFTIFLNIMMILVEKFI